VVRYSVPHDGPEPLDELVLVLYPRTLSQLDPVLSDLTFPRVYPERFSPGDMELLDGDGTPLELQAIPVRGVPDGTFVRLPLDPPVAPGGVAQVELAFRTTVPHRFGTFAHYRWMVALNGGWLPRVAPRAPDGSWTPDAPLPPVDWDLELTYPADHGVVINGQVSAALDGDRGAPGLGSALFGDGRARYRGRARFLTVVLHRDATVTTVDSDSGPLVYVGRPPTDRQQQDLALVADNALGLLREHGVVEASHGTVVVEVPLRWRLVELGEGCVLVSDRYLENDPTLRRFATTQLSRAVMTERLLSAVERRESTADAPAIAEAVSWALLPRYLERRYRFNTTAEELLRPLDFIPSVEQFLYAPRYPFHDEFLNNPYQYDPLHADIRRYHRTGISPRVSLLKVRERVGDQALDGATVDYVASLADAAGPGYLQAIEARSGVSVHATWDAWEDTFPVLNYALEVQREQQGDGWRTHIELHRQVLEEGAWAPEVVQVLATLPARPGEQRTRYELSWDGDGDGTSWQLDTPRRLGRVVVDPRHKVLEADRDGFILRRDNLDPVPLKIWPYGSVGSINVTDGTFSLFAGLAARPANDNRHLWSLDLVHTELTFVGLSFGYGRYFGRSRDELYLRNRVSVGIGVDVLNQAFAATPGLVPTVFDGGIGYRYDSRYGGLFPMRGGRFATSVFGGYVHQTAMPDPDDPPAYIGAAVSGTVLLPFHPRVVLAVRGKGGVTSATLPHKQLVLGGSSDLRGLPERYATGHFKALAALELRVYAIRDINLRMPLGRLQGVQFNTFVEGGWVGDGAPRADELHIGVGGGVRLHYSWFGLWPAHGGIDVAWSPDAPRGNLLPWPVQIYLMLGQSF